MTAHGTPGPAPQHEAGGPAAEAAGAGATALRGGTLRAAGYAAGLALAVISAPLLIRHLGIEEFGRYGKVLALVTIVGGLTESGINAVALRELSTATSRARRDVVLGDLLGLRLITSTVGVGAAVAFAAAAGYGSSLILGTLLAGAALVVNLLGSLLSTVLQSELRFGWATATDLLRQVLSVAMILALVLADAGTVALLAATLPAAVVALILTGALVRPSVSLRLRFSPGRWAALLRDTAVFAVAVAVNTLYFRVTLILLALVASDAAAGEFAVSLRVMEVLIGVPGLLIGAAFPIISRAARNDRDRFDRSAGRLFELALIVGTLVGLAVVLGAPFAVEVLTGSRRNPATVVLQIQGAAIVASFLAAATGYPLLSLHRHRGTLLANGVALAAAVALTLLLAPSEGARGAAVAAVCAEVLLAATNTVLLLRDVSSLPLRAMPVVLGLGGGSAVAGLALPLHPALQAGAGCGLFLAGLLVSRRFPPELLEVLRRPAT